MQRSAVSAQDNQSLPYLGVVRLLYWTDCVYSMPDMASREPTWNPRIGTWDGELWLERHKLGIGFSLRPTGIRSASRAPTGSASASSSGMSLGFFISVP